MGRMINLSLFLLLSIGIIVSMGCDNASSGETSQEITWTKAPSSTFGSAPIYGMAYGSNRFVAVGYGGHIAWSEDGTSWTAVADSRLSSNINTICYGNGKFVAAGGGMAWSTDGKNWTAVADSKISGAINTICHGNGKFLAAGQFGEMAWSMDGENWIAVADSKFSTTINTICYGSGKFVALGAGGKAAWSADGENWTLATDVTSIASFDLRDVCYGNNKFVAVAMQGKITWSADGNSWTAVTGTPFSTSTSAGVFCITYNMGQFIAGGGSTSSQFGLSADGTTWEILSYPSGMGTGAIQAIAYGEGRYIAGCQLGRIIYSNILK